MELLLDSGEPKEILEARATGLLSGVTTNPKIYGKLGTDFLKRLDAIVEASPGYVFTQVIGWHDVEELLGQARWLAKKSPKIVVKLPMSEAGLRACQILKKENPEMTIAITAVAAVWQALMCGKAGADIVALFNGALDTVSDTPVHIVEPVRQIYTNYGYKTRILSCARFPRGAAEFAVAGSDLCTVGIEYWRMLFEHPYTYQRMMGFMEDWHKAFGDQKWPSLDGPAKV
ncbi:MAG TPA: transaldolase family protein [Candidatus Hydrogenedentes bacterium]|nr:transaldolase family protein [Candidatus Hydrogenedentota bacterium]